MILVTLGTQDKSFTRLLEAIEKEIKKKNINEEVIVQAGYTEYKSEYMKVFNTIPKDEFIELIEKCDLLITHGGVGSIFDGLKRNKKIIVAPRLSKYNEHTNDHQLEVVKELSKEGYIIPIYEMKDLPKALKKVKNWHPQKYKSNNENMISLIENYIENNQRRSFFRILKEKIKKAKSVN